MRSIRWNWSIRLAKRRGGAIIFQANAFSATVACIVAWEMRFPSLFYLRPPFLSFFLRDIFFRATLSDYFPLVDFWTFNFLLYFHLKLEFLPFLPSIFAILFYHRFREREWMQMKESRFLFQTESQQNQHNSIWRKNNYTIVGKLIHGEEICNKENMKIHCNLHW